MATKRIRQLSVETVVNIPDSVTTKFISMIYTVGATRPFRINNEKVVMTISDIVIIERQGLFYFVLYITNNEVTKEWMEIPVNDRTTIYNFID